MPVNHPTDDQPPAHRSPGWIPWLRDLIERTVFAQAWNPFVRLLILLLIVAAIGWLMQSAGLAVR
jgi:hypothetical protein